MYNSIIAIDGPAGAGKSTIAKRIAQLLNYTYIDTGAIYRALTLKILDNNVDCNDIKKIEKIAESVEIDFKDNKIYLDGVNVDSEIRQNRINNAVSLIAAISLVRKIMVDKQRKIALDKNVIMDGRDVGTVIFPSADYKFFITANISERAKRRYSEMIQNGLEADLKEIKEQIEKRDYNDINRAESPLKIADDAIYIDTTGKSIDEVVCEVINHINKKNK